MVIFTTPRIVRFADRKEGKVLFLATFIICLREGLEASLIVGILAAFLKRAKVSLKWLVIAVIAAVLVSLAVGLGLMFASQALPQAQQEAMETIIGIIAVIFVTTMILWMNTNGRKMRSNLEGQASESLSRGGAHAMAGMAFLSVLKEGFETAVFLLAVFQSSHTDVVGGIIGCIVGLVGAVIIGFAIYYGGSRFNISTFFKVTGPFLIAVAAGFVANAFRTGHEAGWINFGQTQVFDFSSVITNDSVVGALINGVFSIQADPRLIEVIAWFAYLVPVMIVYLWPQRFSMKLAMRSRFKFGVAGVCAIIAIVMFAAVPRPNVSAGDTRQIASNETGATSVQLLSTNANEAVIAVTSSTGTQQVTLQKIGDITSHEISYTSWEGKQDVTTSSDLPSTVSLGQLLKLNNGLLPSGLSFERDKGPFNATWSESATYDITTSGQSLVNASADVQLIANLTGGSLTGTRTVVVNSDSTGDWAVSDDEVSSVKETLEDAEQQYLESSLYWGWIPAALGGTAIGVGISGLLDRRKVKAEAAESKKTVVSEN